ncbi:MULTISPECIES: phage portal protein [unclassified Acidocella]|uniref:phage portal protein n=1 Tax=unclassified Acidocella TaxID=2648610 RepID=UPI00028F07D0|nr:MULTISPECIES: phage portal protein [unclassified Acidocella]EKN01114.1 lambda family phage portal protein [Acidocella sp. MX-AZ02]WBO60555.1 phage portal protein [Acidocella sp. MX-AZ03]
MFKASQVKENDRWPAIPVSPDVFISTRQQILVARSREQWSNNDYVRGYVRRCRQNIVGEHGVKLHSRVVKKNGKADSQAVKAIEAAHAEWSEPGNCDVTGKLSWRHLQGLAIEHAVRDGEFIFRKIRGDNGGKFGFALQVIDPQRLPIKYEQTRWGENGNFVRQGIEFSRFGKPIAYHFSSVDEWDDYFYNFAGQGFIRVPADEIIHGFVTEMAGQRRGIPWTSTGLFRMHHLQGFEDAAVQNARASATKMGFIKYREGTGPELDDDADVAGSIEAESLSFHELPEGAELDKFDPQYPSGEFAVFTKAMVRGAATGWGVSYNSLANDLEGVNFSSIRDGKQDERDNWKELQAWLIETLIRPVFREWLAQALLRGLVVTNGGKPLAAHRLNDYLDAHFQGRRWPWIDPKSDATGKVTEIRAGLNSPSNVIRESGKEPNRVYEEIAEDIELMKAAGIPEQFIMVMMGLLPAPEPSTFKGDESVAKEPEPA